jgi:ABC-2 type transport system ATP-binding protein
LQTADMSSNNIILKLDGLTKRFDDLVAVDSLSLNIRQGTVFGFLGPNGAGKTTTIKMITGLLEPDEGDVEICGYNLRKDPLKVKEYIGYVPEEPFLYSHLTGLEFLKFIAEVKKVNAKDEIDYLLESFRVGQKKDELIKTYSHGMLKKIVVIAALLGDPRILLFDEVFNGLDPLSIYFLKQEIKKRAEAGQVIFLSSHLIDIVKDVCDEVGIIDKGKLLAIGKIAGLCKKHNKESLEELFIVLTG